MRTYIIHSILLFCFVTYISAFPTGAPTCSPTAKAMAAVANTPMGKAAKLGYTLTMEKTFTPGKAFKITTSKIQFAGFFLSFVDAKGNNVGEIDFGKSPLRFATNCKGNPKSAVTHTSPAKKSSLSLTWTPPKNFADKKITVNAFYVQNAKAGFQSLTAEITSTGGATNTTTTPSSGAPTATTSPAKATTSPAKATASPSGGTATPSGGGYDQQTGTDTGATGTPTNAANTATNAAVTGTPTTTPSSSGMSISQYSSFGALVLANVAAVAILL